MKLETLELSSLVRGRLAHVPLTQRPLAGRMKYYVTFTL